MKKLIKFIKMTLIGGLLVILPVWLAILLLLKAIKAALGLLKPIAAMVPQEIVNDYLIAFALLLMICFAAGLLVHARCMWRPGLWFERHILERMPGYTLLRGMTRRLSGSSEEQTFQPALVEIEEALVPAFIVEKHPDGQFTVFVSSSPTPMAGTIYILPPERVHPVDIPLATAMASIAKWGAGSGKWLSAMRPK
ncbi:MAG: hypothetical protein A2X62_14945 [Stygiobacter sp. GWC2_38_9]|nr:MAG: hypothetical protein A2X62_14945 [Stygiobacter sp. GWC2_38_9]